MLPNLVVIGAQKCGTSSLHEYLDLHPQISMSRPKELRFFIDDSSWERGNWARGRDWYEEQFHGSAVIRGESTPGYSSYPFFPKVPERMVQIIPEARLIYLVRDPLERIVSEYLQKVRNHPEDMRSFEDRLVPFEESMYVARSCYAMQLERFLQFFALDRILVLETSELASAPLKTMARVFEFLGVGQFSSPLFERRHNARAAAPPRLTRPARHVVEWLDRTLGADRSVAVRGVVPTVVRKPFLRPLSPELDSALRNRLIDYLRPDVARLRAWTGLNFNTWCV